MPDEEPEPMPLGRRGVVSDGGRELLARVVSIDHDWALRFSSEDMLIAALSDLHDDDLEGAYLLAHHMTEAIGCVELRRQMGTPEGPPG